MDKTTTSTNRVLPTPTLVLSLDSTGSVIALDIKNIIEKVHPQQAAASGFYHLVRKEITTNSPDHMKYQLLPLEPCHSEQLTQAITCRWEAFERFIPSLSDLGVSLETALHGLRVHEKLIEIGLGDVPILPLDVIILADITRPESGGILPPLLSMVQRLLAHEADGMAHLLLSTTDYDSHPVTGSTIPTLNTWYTLLELEAYANPFREAFRTGLAHKLGLEELKPLSCRIYLFDRLKEGSREVKDQAEVGMIMGNFLLAMLTAGFAHRQLDDYPWSEIQDRNAYFSSAGATAMFVDPHIIADLCAARLGASFLSDVLTQVNPSSRQVVEAFISNLGNRLGDPIVWIETLCKNTPLTLASQEVCWVLDYHIHDLLFEGVPEAHWSQHIQAYAESCQQDDVPAINKTIEENANLFCVKTNEIFCDVLDRLVPGCQQNIGGLQDAASILQKLSQWIVENQNRIQATAVERHRNSLEAQLQALSQAVNRIKPLPKMLAAFLNILELVLDVKDIRRWWQYRNTDIISMREACIHSLEQEIAATFQKKVEGILPEIYQDLQKCLETSQADLEHLKTQLSTALHSLTKAAEVRLPESSTFRSIPWDANALAGLYCQYEPPFEFMRLSLTEDFHWLEDWRHVEAGELVSQLLDYGRDIYARIMDLGLLDVLKFQGNDPLNVRITQLIQGTVPLLRPEFDRYGGGYSHPSRHIFVPDPTKSEVREISLLQFRDWEIILTGNPWMILCNQVRHLVPFDALSNITAKASQAYEKLDAEEQRPYRILEILLDED